MTFDDINFRIHNNTQTPEFTEFKLTADHFVILNIYIFQSISFKQSINRNSWVASRVPFQRVRLMLLNYANDGYLIDVKFFFKRLLLALINDIFDNRADNFLPLRQQFS